jgi:RNA polymerase sigma-70 factor (ECF subfamily)
MLDAVRSDFGLGSALPAAMGGWSPARASTRPRAESRESLSARFEDEALPHTRALYSTAYRITRNAADAEDLLQETLLRALRAFDGYAPGTNIRAWLFTILYRTRTDQLRKLGRSPRTVELVDQEPAAAPPQAALACGHEAIERALGDLPEAFRAAVVLRDVEELSYDEIARALSIPIGTVMSRIHRGRSLLRQALSSLRAA